MSKKTVDELLDKFYSQTERTERTIPAKNNTTGKDLNAVQTVEVSYTKAEFKAELAQLLLEEMPGTAIIDWDDFKSEEERQQYLGYCQAIDDVKIRIKAIFGVGKGE